MLKLEAISGMDCQRNTIRELREAHVESDSRDLHWLDSFKFLRIFCLSNLPLKVIIYCVTDQPVTACSWRSVLNYKLSVFTFLRLMNCLKIETMFRSQSMFNARIYIDQSFVQVIKNFGVSLLSLILDLSNQIKSSRRKISLSLQDMTNDNWCTEFFTNKHQLVTKWSRKDKKNCDRHRLEFCRVPGWSFCLALSQSVDWHASF